MRRTSLLILLVFGCVNGQAMAKTINIDFAPNINVTPGAGSNIFSVDYVGTAAAPDAGTVWNSLVANNTGANGYDFQDANIGLFDFAENGFASYSNLLDSNGSATPVGISFDAGGVFAVSNNAPNLNNIATDAKGLMRDYLIAFRDTHRSGARTVTLSGLPIGQQVLLYLYGEGDNTANDRSTMFTVGATMAGTTGDAGNAPLTLGSDYVVFENVFADANGEIVISYAAGLNANNQVVPEGPFNGLQLVFVPEPGTAALMSLAGLGLLAIRRKW